MNVNGSTILKVNDLMLFFDGSAKPVLKNLNFEAKEGEFISILGPSGCGKTTLLYSLAGLITPKKGTIEINGKKKIGVNSEASLVFQDSLLMPWRNVISNIMYGAEKQKKQKKEIEKKARYWLKTVGLKDYAQYWPHQLSGGMRQRVNLARGLVSDPQILLLDEPFAHLDALLRESMQKRLLEIFLKSKKTFILVTHQIDEAIYLGDRILIMGKNPGRIIEAVDVKFRRPRLLSIKEDKAFIKLKSYLRSKFDEIS